jgi:hypothetical membrane protein
MGERPDAKVRSTTLWKHTMAPSAWSGRFARAAKEQAMAEKATLWLLRFGIAVPLIYYGIQALAAPFYPGFSVLGTTASELGSDKSEHAVIFNAGIMVQGVASIAAALGFFAALRPIRINSSLAALTALALAMTGIQHIWAGCYPIPDPRHGGHLPFIVAMTVLPVLLTATLWRQVGIGLRVYFVSTLVLLAAALTLRSGLSGHDRYEYRGLLQRVFSLAIFPPIGVAAYALASRIRQGPITEAQLFGETAHRGPM